MNEHPILFSGPMVQAILAGRKTQTRRIVKPQPSSVEYWLHGERANKFDGVCSLRDEKGTGWTISCGKFKPFYGLPSRQEVVGVPVLSADRIFVKEDAWMFCEKVPNGKTKTDRQKFKYRILNGVKPFYCADHPEKPTVAVAHAYTGNEWLWRKKIGRFLPKKYCRLTLEITAVRVERLQDISEEDACREGVTIGQVETGVEHNGMKEYMPESPTDAYIRLWESINGEGSWAMNPFVWVISFRKL